MYLKEKNGMMRKQVLFALALILSPMCAYADWGGDAQNWAKNTQIALYAIAGTAAIGSLVWQGLRWLIARMTDSHEMNLMGYLQQAMVIVMVGASVIIATAAWQFAGGTS
jgi:uncharacterized membrane protein YidH (DUF202 family)